MKQPPVAFHFLYQPVPLKNRKRLKEFILKLFQTEGKKLEHLSYVFCSDEYLYRLNVSFLKHDTYTDVITFDLSSNKQFTTGESYISIERVRENAALSKTTFTNELHRVMFHSALHLCGYNDKSVKEKQQIRTKEDEYLNKYFVPRDTVS
jgi:rRNA maturation RNase YbeY